MKNLNAIRTIERMNQIIEEMRKLKQEFEEIINQETNEELTDEEMTELIENDCYDWENDLGEDEEDNEIYKIYFNEEEFELFFELTKDAPYGYVHNTIANEFIVTIDEYTIYEVKDILDKQRSYELYEECNRFAADEIRHLQDEIYLQMRAQDLY